MHDCYAKMMSRWKKCRHAYMGDVRRNGHLYYVIPRGLVEAKTDETTTRTASFDVAVGGGLSVPAVEYIARSKPPLLSQRMVQTLVSIAGTYEPEAVLPPDLEYLRENATPDGKSLTQLFLMIVSEILLVGRSPCLLDVAGGRLVISRFDSEILTDWVTSGGGESLVIEQVLLSDSVTSDDFVVGSDGDRYVDREIVLGVDDGGYWKRVTVDDEEGGKEYISVTGRGFDSIPMVVAGSIENTPDADVIPIENVADCTIKIANLDAMLSNAEQASCCPSFILSGVDESDVPSVTGAGVCLPLPDYTSKAYYTKTDTSAMSHIQSRMADYFSEAMESGVSLLGTRNNQSESGEALRLRQAASTASLKTIVRNAGAAIDTLLKQAAEWSGVSGVASFRPNDEFTTFNLTANEIRELRETWLANGISHVTLLDNLRRTGSLIAGDSIDDELERINQSQEGVNNETQ